jgi:hypothetical protein
MDRNTILNMLRSNAVNLEFTKVDGSVRKMVATLNEYLIPLEQLPKVVVADKSEHVKPVKAKNLEVVRCFDLQAQAWRSFKISSLIKELSINEDACAVD